MHFLNFIRVLCIPLKSLDVFFPGPGSFTHEPQLSQSLSLHDLKNRDIDHLPARCPTQIGMGLYNSSLAPRVIILAYLFLVPVAVTPNSSNRSWTSMQPDKYNAEHSL